MDHLTGARRSVRKGIKRAQRVRHVAEWFGTLQKRIEPREYSSHRFDDKVCRRLGSGIRTNEDKVGEKEKSWFDRGQAEKEIGRFDQKEKEGHEEKA